MQCIKFFGIIVHSICIGIENFEFQLQSVFYAKFNKALSLCKVIHQLSFSRMFSFKEVPYWFLYMFLQDKINYTFLKTRPAIPQPTKRRPANGPFPIVWKPLDYNIVYFRNYSSGLKKTIMHYFFISMKLMQLIKNSFNFE